MCKHCPAELGNVVKYSDSFLPTLTASKLQMERKDNTGGNMGDLPNNRRTWAMITAQYFVVDPIAAADLVSIFRSRMGSFLRGESPSSRGCPPTSSK